MSESRRAPFIYPEMRAQTIAAIATYTRESEQSLAALNVKLLYTRLQHVWGSLSDTTRAALLSESDRLRSQQRLSKSRVETVAPDSLDPESQSDLVESPSTRRQKLVENHIEKQLEKPSKSAPKDTNQPQKGQAPENPVPAQTEEAVDNAAKQAGPMLAEVIRIIAGDLDHKAAQLMCDGPLALLALQSAEAKNAADQARAIAALAVQDVEKLRQNVAPAPIQITIKDHPPIELPPGTAHPLLPRVIQLLNAGLNIWLTGPAGCGKTHLAAQAAEVMKLPFYSYGALDSKYSVTGFIDAQSNYRRTPARAAIEEGGLCLFDEIDASDPKAILSLNQLLANDRFDFADANVRKHANFRAIACANTFGTGATAQYVGRTRLDAASLNRFYKIAMDYDPTLEKTLAAQYGSTGLEWYEKCRKFRNRAASTDTQVIVSTRTILMGCAALVIGESMDNVTEALVLTGLDRDARARLLAK